MSYVAFSRGRACLATVTLAASVIFVGCAAPADESSSQSQSADLDAAVHTPAGAERSAILAAFRAPLTTDLHGQVPLFNATDPVGRFLAHGDWAYFEGILEGPNNNAQPINYDNSTYKDTFDAHVLGGVQRGGNFAAKFQGLAHKQADGSWQIAQQQFGATSVPPSAPAYSVGPTYDAWKDWVSLPPPAQRDVFASFPVDDLHTPQGDEAAAILGALTAQVTQDVNGQAVSFDTTDAPGVFLAHDGWAYVRGIVLGANDNAQAVNYQNSIYAHASGSFQGVLHNNNFAASCQAIFKKDADGSWHIHPTTGNSPAKGYDVGTNDWVGDVGSEFAYDIFGKGGNGNGNGDGDGE